MAICFFYHKNLPFIEKIEMDSDENVPEKMEDEARNDHDNEFKIYQVRLTIQEFKYKNRYETKIILVNLLKM